MSKANIYFVPGLAANSKIYEYLQLDLSKYECHFLEWKIPRSKNESMQAYAQRMCEDIVHKNPILIGVSFGGILVQEMSKLIDTKKVIIISSVKTNVEYPKRLRLIAATKAYKLIPIHFIAKLDSYLFYILRRHKQKKIAAYKKYLSVRNAKYLYWALQHLLLWEQTEELKNIAHIHGTNDGIFPSKKMKNFIQIERGTHTMILTKAKKISLEIDTILTCQYHSN